MTDRTLETVGSPFDMSTDLESLCNANPGSARRDAANHRCVEAVTRACTAGGDTLLLHKHARHLYGGSHGRDGLLRQPTRGGLLSVVPLDTHAA